MTHERHRPTYSLDEVKSLAACGRFLVNGRSLRWIRNHLGRFDGASVVRQIIEGIDAGNFSKAVSLRISPGTWADVYRFVYTGDDELDGDDGWYVKLYVDEEERAVHLNVLSANWEGYIH